VFRSCAGTNKSKIDTTLLSNKDWVQSDTAQSALNQFKEPSRLVLNQNKTWVNQTIGQELGELIVISGRWEFKDNSIIIYDPFTHGLGFECKIIELTNSSLVINYQDIRGKKVTVQLKELTK